MALSTIQWNMILGGFGLFMFGITFMGDGLKAVAGDQLRDYIDRYTSNPLSALLIGILLTIIMQSSSATTAITIGLVRAGLMSLDQAAGIVFGANIGTTITSFLISINIEKYALYIVFVGSLMICFGKSQKIKYFGDVLLGFGLIFFGMSAMGDALAALKEMPQFTNFALTMSRNPLLAMGAGVILTAAVQSSAATIGVIQKLYNAGAVTFSASLPFMFGANIGTTATGMLAAIGGPTAGKRTAGLHTFLNIVATVLGMALLVPYSKFIQMIAGNMNPMMQIAIANIIFKVVTTVMFLPFTKQLVALVRRIIPGSEPEALEINIDELDINVAEVLPSAGIKMSQSAMLKMVDVVRQFVIETQQFLNKQGTAEDKDLLDRSESLINKFDQKITEYLIKLSVVPNLTDMDKLDVRLNLDVTKNLERLGDVAMNLVEFFLMVTSSKTTFSPDAMKEMNDMFDQFISMYDDCVYVFVTKDPYLYQQLLKKEETMDMLELNARNAHFERMSNKICESAVADSVYCDILANLERMGDHCCNIARSAINASTSSNSEDEPVLD